MSVSQLLSNSLLHYFSDRTRSQHQHQAQQPSSSRRRHQHQQQQQPTTGGRCSRSPLGNDPARGASPPPLQQQQQAQQDRDGHLVVQAGASMHGGRYTVLQLLGEGTFGRVVEAADRRAGGAHVAVKVVRNIAKYREAALLEVKVLQTLKRRDPPGRFHCVQLRHHFDYQGHMCLVFDMLGESVFDFQKRNNYAPYPMDQVRSMAYQLAYAVKFLHDSGLTHTDLKPENILFCNSSDWRWTTCSRTGRQVRVLEDPSIRLIDFGSATFDNEHHTKIVSTRHYRAPEVVLELGWSHPCDVWSIACIIFEIYTGECLFMTHDNIEHLAMMERCLGSLPSHMIKASPKTRYFHRGRLAWRRGGSETAVQPLRRYMEAPDSREHRQLFDLLEALFAYEPRRRAELSRAIEHAFFESLPQRLQSHRYHSSSPHRR